MAGIVITQEPRRRVATIASLARLLGSWHALRRLAHYPRARRIRRLRFERWAADYARHQR